MKRIGSVLHYGYELFAKHLFINILLILELIISIVAINLTVAKIQGLYIDVDIIETASDDTLFIMQGSRHTASGEERVIDLSDIKGSFSVGEEKMMSLRTPFETNGNITIYNKAILENVEIPLKKGSWFASVIEENGKNYYPVIINDEESVRYGDRFEALTDTKEVLYCYVAGVLDNNGRYFKLSAASNIATTQQLIDKSPDELKLFCNAEHFPVEKASYTHTYRGRALFFESVTEDELAHNIQVLKNQAFTFTKNDIISNSMETIDTNVRYYVPLCVGLLIISVLGLFSFAFLSLYKNSNFYKTAILCGARRSDCVLIGFVSFDLLFVLSTGIICIIYAISYGLAGQNDLKFGGMNLLITGAIYVILMLFGYLLPQAFFSKGRTHKIITQGNAIQGDR